LQAGDVSEQSVYPLSGTGPELPPDDLEPLRALVGDATVVGVARTAHGSREMTELTHRVLRHLVTELGFRTLAIEADAGTGLEVDAWLHTGRGDVADRLSATHPWWRSPEFRAVLDWVRTYNKHHADDPLRLLGLVAAGPRDMNELEQHFATTIERQHAHTGHRILYWSGSHSSVGHRRLIEWRPGQGGEGGRNAGSYLREALGAGYVSLGITCQRGAVRWAGGIVEVLDPPEGFTDAILSRQDPDHYLLDLHAEENAALARTPLRYRAVGPHYDPKRPAAMTGGPVGEFFDGILHIREVTPAGE
jgi:erythromycin esterase